MAGMAFANAGVTAVHAFAYPIGAEYHIPHGVANSIMLGPVMEFNLLGNLNKFADIARILGQPTKELSYREAALRVVNALRMLAEDLRVPSHLSSFGVTEARPSPACRKRDEGDPVAGQQSACSDPGGCGSYLSQGAVKTNLLLL